MYLSQNTIIRKSVSHILPPNLQFRNSVQTHPKFSKTTVSENFEDLFSCCLQVNRNLLQICIMCKIYIQKLKMEKQYSLLNVLVTPASYVCHLFLQRAAFHFPKQLHSNNVSSSQLKYATTFNSIQKFSCLIFLRTIFFTIFLLPLFMNLAIICSLGFYVVVLITPATPGSECAK